MGNDVDDRLSESAEHSEHPEGAEDHGGGVVDDGDTAAGGYGERGLTGDGAAERARRHAEDVETSHSAPPDATRGSAEPGAGPAGD